MGNKAHGNLRVWLVLLGCLVVLTIVNFSNVAEATNSNQTDIGVQFKDEAEVIPPVNLPGNIYEPPVKPSIRPSLLPKTGELISSFIVVLLGISVLIITLGISYLRRIYIFERLVM